jgi:hypothetical protein
VGFNTYKNYVNATFWYQSAGGGWSGEGYIDGAFTGDSAILLHASVTLMTWVLAERMDDLMSCAASKTVLEIPSRYVFTDGYTLVPGFDTQKLKRDLEAMFFFGIPFSTHIAIGAFNNPAKDGGIKLGVTWSEPLDSRPQNEKDLSNITSLGSVLIGINHNVHSDALNLLTLGTSAGSIFHEILHNFGFDHGDNKLSSYKDRTKALFALEDCMCNIVRERVNQGNLNSLKPGTVWVQPSTLGEQEGCSGRGLMAFDPNAEYIIESVQELGHVINNDTNALRSGGKVHMMAYADHPENHWRIFRRD